MAIRANLYPTPYPEADERYDLCACQYTGALIRRDESILLGAVVPQVSHSFVSHPLAGPARKRSVVAFDESEQNCNTCAKLVRLPFTRDRSGLMPGKCECFNESHPYFRGDHFLFCPDDWMGMECHQLRHKVSS